MAKQQKRKTSPLSYKTQTKIPAYPTLAQAGFEQPGRGSTHYQMFNNGEVNTGEYLHRDEDDMNIHQSSLSMSLRLVFVLV